MFVQGRGQADGLIGEFIMLRIFDLTAPLVLVAMFLFTSVGVDAMAATTTLFDETWAEAPRVALDALTPTAPGGGAGAMATSTQGLAATIHGPYGRQIRTAPGWLLAEGPWAFSLRRAGKPYDLRDGTIEVNGRQDRPAPLRVLIKLPGDLWYVSGQAIQPGASGLKGAVKLRSLNWTRYDVIRTKRMSDAGENLKPDLSRVEEMGLTALGEEGVTRIESMTVTGAYFKASGAKKKAGAVKAPGPIKSTRVATKLLEGVKAYRGVVYARYGERELTLDLHRPAHADNHPPALPAVVFIHGGGMYKGDPSSYTAMSMALAKHGYVTANIYYRLSGEAKFPAALHDCKAAVRFLRANAEKYGVDADHIGSVGGSAGGWLSGLLATAGPVGRLEGDGNHSGVSSQLQAGCVMAGAMDWTTPESRQSAANDPRRRIRTFLGGTWEEAKRNYVDSSAITHVDQHTPPMLFLDGEFDSPGTRYNGIRPKMKSLGIDSQEYTIKGAPHPFWSSEPFFDEAMGHMVRFFNATLKQ